MRITHQEDKGRPQGEYSRLGIVEKGLSHNTLMEHRMLVDLLFMYPVLQLRPDPRSSLSFGLDVALICRGHPTPHNSV